MSIRLWADDQLLKFIVRRADRLVTGPESMVDYYVRTYGVDRMRIVTLYNDVDTSRYRPPPDDERSRLREALGLPPGRCVLFVGRVSRYKGGEFLVPLQGGLASDGPDDAYLTVVGPIHLHELAGPLERARNVVLTGSKPNDDVIRYMQVADVFILPSLSEGFPRVVIEAMAAGVPVVAFDVGGVRDILGPAQRQLIVRSGDVQAMLTGVRRILADPELAAGLRSENLEQVKRFDTEVVADMFVERIVKG